MTKPPAAPAALMATSLALAAILAPGCAADNPGARAGPLSPSGAPSSTPGAGAGADWSPDPAALLPERIRIHPLTRVAPDPDDRPQLALHLELKDRFGHNIKSLGWLRIELSGARQDSDDPAAAADGRHQDVYWEVDLRDPEQNALMYDDLISRTYLIYLGGLPDWVQRWAQGDAGVALDPWLNLSATFIARESTGTDRILRDHYRLER